MSGSKEETHRNGRLAGRVCAITGGASGIGRATAFRFLDEGASVVVGDLNPANLQTFRDDAAARGYADHSRAVTVDVSNEAEIAAMVATAASEFGALDVIFNNAGIGGAFGPIEDIESADWDETFAVLVRGVFLGCKYAVRQMDAQGTGGSIINTASVAGLLGGGGPVPYSAAKAAVVNFTRALSLELAPRRIRVNAICPGAIMTPLLAQGRKVPLSERPPMQPWPEHGQPEHIAGAALFLASDDSAFVTGEAIVVDGGLHASGPSGWTVNETSPSRWVGMNRGTTGQPPTVRRRG